MDNLKFRDIKVGDIFKFDPRGPTEYVKTNERNQEFLEAGLARYSHQPDGKQFFVLNDEEIEYDKENRETS